MTTCKLLGMKKDYVSYKFLPPKKEMIFKTKIKSGSLQFSIFSQPVRLRLGSWFRVIINYFNCI